MTPSEFLNRLEKLFADRGAEQYGGEKVSQLEHALQAAWEAEKDGATPELVVAALLHDVGHLLHGHDEDCAEQGIDDHHEELGQRYLRQMFGPAVTEPIRLHVPAKRFLSATEPSYPAALSPASARSLQLQGGPMTAEEVLEFRDNPYSDSAVRLRRWDESAKIPDLATPPFAHFRTYLELCCGQPPNEIGLVVFDWAGTTIDFGCMAPAGAFVAAFAERGLPVSVPEARRPMGLHKKDHIRAMLQDPDLSERWEKRFGRSWGESDVEDLYRLVTPMQVAAAKEYSDLIPGVLACVAKLRSRNTKVAATTGYFREAAEVVYAAGKAQGYEPDAAICADEVPAGRPAPWMIFRVMEKLGVYPTSAVVKVGDTTVDIEDGKNAGVWSVGVVDSSNEMGLSVEAFAMLSEEDRDALRLGVRSKFFASGADAVIQDLSELPPLVGELNRRLRTGRRP